VSDLAAKWSHFLPQSNADRTWPTFAKSLLWPKSDYPGSAFQAWVWSIETLRDFRQKEGFARNEGKQPNRPGRSLWPEPETIRETVHANRLRSGHQRLPNIPADAVPRAEFGLPIIFELRNEADVPKTSLQPLLDGQPGDRMASPLILKPLGLAGNKALPIILRLDTPSVCDVVLMKGKEERRRFGADAIRGNRLVTTGKQPMSYSKTGSALDAFVNYAIQEAGFKEVRP
jgi:CRISPR-associated protein Cmr1